MTTAERERLDALEKRLEGLCCRIMPPFQSLAENIGRGSLLFRDFATSSKKGVCGP